MKHLLCSLLLVSFASTCALADSPAKITEDYRKAAAAALVRVNDTLEKATVPLIAALVKSGDTAGADELRDQLKAKIAGESVAKPQASAAALFKSYDGARAKALEPAQKSAVARIDSMLSSSEGKKLEVVTELSKVREEIAAGKLSQAVTFSKADLRSFLKQNKLAKIWGYYYDPAFTKKYGMLFLNEDGTLVLNSGGSFKGTWVPTSDPTVVAVEISDGDKPVEKTEIRIKGQEVTIMRPTGVRYLRPEE